MDLNKFNHLRYSTLTVLIICMSQDYDDELYRTTEDAFGEHESNLGIILPRIEKAGLKLDEVGAIKEKSITCYAIWLRSCSQDTH